MSPVPSTLLRRGTKAFVSYRGSWMVKNWAAGPSSRMAASHIKSCSSCGRSENKVNCDILSLIIDVPFVI